MPAFQGDIKETTAKLAELFPDRFVMVLIADRNNYSKPSIIAHTTCEEDAAYLVSLIKAIANDHNKRAEVELN